MTASLELSRFIQRAEGCGRQSVSVRPGLALFVVSLPYMHAVPWTVCWSPLVKQNRSSRATLPKATRLVPCSNVQSVWHLHLHSRGMSDHDGLIAEFCSITSAAADTGRDFLAAHEWQLESALNTFFHDPEPASLAAFAAPAPLPHSAGGTGAAPAAGGACRLGWWSPVSWACVRVSQVMCGAACTLAYTLNALRCLLCPAGEQQDDYVEVCRSTSVPAWVLPHPSLTWTAQRERLGRGECM